jgi:alpha-glucosidase
MGMADHDWWRAGVLYQVYPRSFADTDGDGVGDLSGITSRLGHLRDLGVDAVWISPFYPSPMADFGYDVTDHTGVDPLFGDLADFDHLVQTAHGMGIRVLVDFVPNHTSDRHPWFVDARSSRDHPRRNWYLWADPAPDGGPPNNWRSVFGGSAWTLDEASGQFYYHAYLAEQPDLNWRDPDVWQAQHDVLRCWLDRGVDGFRLDATRQLIKDDQLRDNPPNPDYHEGQPPYDALFPVYTTDRPEMFDVLAGMRAVVDERRPDGDGLLLAEMYLPVRRLVHYYGERGEGVQMPSNMHLISTPHTAKDIGDLIAGYEAALPVHAWPNWVLGNHDRPRVASRVGAAQARVAAMLLLTLRGTPLVYYGDEIGMTDVPVPDELVRDPLERRVPGTGRDPERSPMRWTPAVHGGFCSPDVSPWLPMPAGLSNVRDQQGDPHSMLTLYRSLISLRKAEPALALGRYVPVSSADDVLVYRREHGASRFLVALNLGGERRTLPVDGGVVRVGTAAHRAGQRVGSTLTLTGDEGVVIEVSA